MRPVNLIPPEERRGERAPLRTGPAAYALIAVLAVALIGVTAVVMTNNQVADRETRLAELEAREASARAQAEALAPYAEFASLSESRRATVDSLAKSRFDWERVLRELALVIPGDVWLTGTTGSASPGAQLEGAPGVGLRSEVAGPALELVGCAASQDSVAAFVAALNDIDGVTRVGLESSERPEEGAGGGDSAGSGGEAGADCRTRDFIAKFEIVMAFDAAPVSSAAATTEGAAPVATEGTTPETQQAEASTNEQVSEAQNASEIAPGVGE